MVEAALVAFRPAYAGHYPGVEEKKLADVSISDIAALLGDSNFIRLQQARSAFNTFDVLRLKHHEIRHSNVLAWLFDPQESHKFGFAFLEQFLLKLASCAESDEQKKNIKYALLLLAKGEMHVSVHREEPSEGKKRVDLQIECFLPDVENKRCGFVILIENKVHAKQGNKQLQTYLDNAKNKHPDMKIIPVYLTVDEGDNPLDKKYFHLTYNDVLDILESLTGATESERSEEPARLFIKDYIKTLKELLSIDTKKQECAKEIYKNHKSTIDSIRKTKNANANKEEYTKEVYRKNEDLIEFIYKNRENWMAAAGNQFVEQYNQSLEQYNKEHYEDFKLSAIDKSNASFFPFTDSVLEGTEGGSDKDWRGGTVCGYYFRFYPKNEDNADGFSGTLAFAIEVGPFADSGKRQKLLETLNSKGITSSDSSIYTRLSYSHYKKKLQGSIPIADVTDIDEVAGKMKNMFEEREELREKLHEGITAYLKEQQKSADGGNNT